MDPILAIKESFGWINSDAAKWKVVWLYLVSVVFGILMMVVAYQFITENISTLLPFMANAAMETSDPDVARETMGVFIGLIVSVLGIMIVGGLLQSFIHYRITQDAMKERGMRVEPLGLMGFIRMIGFEIYYGLLNMLSWYDKRGLAILVAAIILFAVGIMIPVLGILLAIIGVILAMGYFVMVVRHSVRTYSARAYMLQGNASITGSCKRAWNETPGKALDIFITTIIAGIAVGILFMIASYILSFVVELLVSSTVQSFVQSMVGDLLGGNETTLNYLVQFIKEQIGQSVSQFIWMPIMLVTQAFLYIAIIVQITGKKTADWSQPPQTTGMDYPSATRAVNRSRAPVRPQTVVKKAAKR